MGVLFPTEWKKKHVPNHQPVMYTQRLWKRKAGKSTMYFEQQFSFVCFGDPHLFGKLHSLKQVINMGVIIPQTQPLLVGGFNHLEKYEFVNGFRMIPYRKWKIIQSCSKPPTRLWWLCMVRPQIAGYKRPLRTHRRSPRRWVTLHVHCETCACSRDRWGETKGRRRWEPSSHRPCLGIRWFSSEHGLQRKKEHDMTMIIQYTLSSR